MKHDMAKLMTANDGRVLFRTVEALAREVSVTAVIGDSCITSQGAPRELRWLENMPATSMDAADLDLFVAMLKWKARKLRDTPCETPVEAQKAGELALRFDSLIHQLSEKLAHARQVKRQEVRA